MLLELLKQTSAQIIAAATTAPLIAKGFTKAGAAARAAGPGDNSRNGAAPASGASLAAPPDVAPPASPELAPPLWSCATFSGCAAVAVCAAAESTLAPTSTAAAAIAIHALLMNDFPDMRLQQT